MKLLFIKKIVHHVGVIVILLALVVVEMEELDDLNVLLLEWLMIQQ